MATTLTPDYKGSYAQPQVPAVAGDCGNLAESHGGLYEAAALAQNKVVAIERVPKGSEMRGLRYANDALGATTVLQFGWAYEDGTDSDVDAFATVADASAASASQVSIMPITLTKDAFIVVKQTGAGTATGTIFAACQYIYKGTA
jgi:hypothetical protein